MDEKPPKVGVGLLQRAALAAALIVFMTAGAVSAAGLLTADDLINTIEAEGREPIPIPENEIEERFDMVPASVEWVEAWDLRAKDAE